MKILQIIFLALTTSLQCTVVGGTEYSAGAFGQSIDVWRDFPISSEDVMKIPLTNDAQISWVCEVEGIGLGLCDNKNAEFILWRNNNLCPKGCTSFFDGCNTCDCEPSGELVRCTMMNCDITKIPQCIEHNCRTKEKWSDEKKEWCCQNEKLGCEDNDEYNCKTKENWSDEKKAWCCQNEKVGCDDNDEYNCLTNEKWSDAKKEWCCENKQLGCDEGSIFSKVSLAPFKKPVGAFQSEVDGLIYVGCFGTYPVPENDSGVVVIDVSDPDHPRVVATYTYPHPHHVHNIYEFYYRPEDKNPEIFLAILGNPWMDPPVPGQGLVMVDRETGAFKETTIARLNVRSAKQPAPGVFYALTQEPEPEQSKLVRLEVSDYSGEDKLVLRAETLLPARDGGDGGADVILGLEPYTLWASDRWAGPGRLYYYSFESSGFVHRATHVATGENARYTVITKSGDMVVCSQNSGTLSLMEGLALSPTAGEVSITTIDTVGTVQFFIESDLIPLAKG